MPTTYWPHAFCSVSSITDIHWVHLDLAASNHKGGLAHIPTDTTGFGVR